MIDKYFTVAEVAGRLGLSEETIRRLCRRGVIRSVRLGWKHGISDVELARIERDGIHQSSVGPRVLRPAEDWAELRGCPFCGARTVRVGWWATMAGGTDREFNVICPRCAATGPTGYTRAAAAQLWNTREEVAPGTD